MWGHNHAIKRDTHREKHVLARSVERLKDKSTFCVATIGDTSVADSVKITARSKELIYPKSNRSEASEK
jgi:hypothetical protein